MVDDRHSLDNDRGLKLADTSKDHAEGVFEVVSMHRDGGTSGHDSLDAARMQWQFGDWVSLVAHTAESLHAHPDRAKIALLVSSAWQQKGDNGQARKFARLALSWGCDRRLAARVLISSAHVSLGRAAALQRDEQRALEHFKSSVEGVSGDARLACQARTTRELMNLGLFRDAARFVQEQRMEHLADTQVVQALQSARSRQSLLSTVNGTVAGENKTILVAGMRHSGSTALFNILRIALQRTGISCLSAYAEHPEVMGVLASDVAIRLIKIHEYRDDVASGADYVFTTRRDLRDSVASAARRNFPSYRTYGGPVGYAKYNRMLHERWAALGDYEFVYEHFMQRPVHIVTEVLEQIGLHGVNAQELYDDVLALPKDDYKTTLLSPTHITDPERTRSFADTLSPEDVEQIEGQNFDWLMKFDYPLTRLRASP